MSVLRFLYQTLCAFLQIKDIKHIEHTFVNFIVLLWSCPRGGTWGCWVGQNFSVGICDGAPPTAHSNSCSFPSRPTEAQSQVKCGCEWNTTYWSILSVDLRPIKSWTSLPSRTKYTDYILRDFRNAPLYNHHFFHNSDSMMFSLSFSIP